MLAALRAKIKAAAIKLKFVRVPTEPRLVVRIYCHVGRRLADSLLQISYLNLKRHGATMCIYLWALRHVCSWAGTARGKIDFNGVLDQ